MDTLNMDERQRLHWLQANRATLFAVGATWVGMIGWELLHQQTPLFLIVMVPVFALLRFGLYLHYSRKNG
jgi:uncharacterized membrane protein AbrB (regulator of aidB expression)